MTDPTITLYNLYNVNKRHHFRRIHNSINAVIEKLNYVGLLDDSVS